MRPTAILTATLLLSGCINDALWNQYNSCSVDEERCAEGGGAIERCVDGEWSATTTCGSLCGAAGGTCEESGEGGAPTCRCAAECTGDATQCVGLDLRTCVGGKWSVGSCDAACRKAGYASADSCGYDAKTRGDTCFCNECAKDATDCVGLDLRVCVDGSWSVGSCDAMCKKAGYVSVNSCEYDTDAKRDNCFCNECTPNTQTCVGLTLHTCDANGRLTKKDCYSVCIANGRPGVMGCGYDTNLKYDVCVCLPPR